MQRIKLDVFKTFFQKNLTGNEIDFLIALSHIQNPQGKAYGVHYREMMKSVKYSFAMKHAKPGVKAAAFYETEKVEPVLRRLIAAGGDIKEVL